MSNDVYINAIDSDTPSGVKYFAECPLYPELIGVGDTAKEAYKDLSTKITAHITPDIYGRIRNH